MAIYYSVLVDYEYLVQYSYCTVDERKGVLRVFPLLAPYFSYVSLIPCYLNRYTLTVLVGLTKTLYRYGYSIQKLVYTCI